ncbi:MAG: pilin [Actinobacteria bacterium]|nr:pilin [Actinomycetota bacterium]
MLVIISSKAYAASPTCTFDQAPTLNTPSQILLKATITNPADNHRVVLRLYNDVWTDYQEVSLKEGCHPKSEFQQNTGVSLDLNQILPPYGGDSSKIKEQLYPDGQYYVEVRDGCVWKGINEAKACAGSFTITNGAIGNWNDSFDLDRTTTPKANILNSPCSKWEDSTNKDDPGKCLSVKTGLGEIGTELPTFIGFIFRIVLGFAGIAVFILIVVSGYILMTSGGDKEKVQAARETITSAIIGFVFLLLSLAILQFIGFSILRIPGFSQ